MDDQPYDAAARIPAQRARDKEARQVKAALEVIADVKGLRAEIDNLTAAFQCAKVCRDEQVERAEKAETGRDDALAKVLAIESLGHREDCAGVDHSSQRCGCGWLEMKGAADYIRKVEAERDQYKGWWEGNIYEDEATCEAMEPPDDCECSGCSTSARRVAEREAEPRTRPAIGPKA